jgi:hypothetical protein
MAEWLAAYDPAVRPDSILSCGADALPFPTLSLSLFSHHIILLSIRRFLRYDDILGVHNSPGDSARQTDSHIARW